MQPKCVNCKRLLTTLFLRLRRTRGSKGIGRVRDNGLLDRPIVFPKIHIVRNPILQSRFHFGNSGNSVRFLPVTLMESRKYVNEMGFTA